MIRKPARLLVSMKEGIDGRPTGLETRMKGCVGVDAPALHPRISLPSARRARRHGSMLDQRRPKHRPAAIQRVSDQRI